MKRKIYSIMAAGLLALSLSSCNDWLDVPVDGKSTSSELFAVGDGYRSVLNGMYKSMANPVLYGDNLQFGLVDFFSNQYDINKGNGYLSSELYIAAGKRDYTNPALQPALDAIWQSAYKIIATANDVITNIEGADNDKFSQGEMEKNMILGEAKAIRAFLHFDMLRLYAPAPIDDDNQVHIPYITTFPEAFGQHLTNKEVMTKIITDLEEARELVKPYDQSPLGMSASVTGNARFYNDLTMGMEGYSNKSEVDKFFLGRGYRLSYWAITALLSRVYQYNATYEPADLDKAKSYAEEVLNVSFKSLDGKATYSPFKEENFKFMYNERPEDMTDLRMVGNLIFGVNNEDPLADGKMDIHFPNKMGYTDNNVFVVNRDGQDIFKTVAGEDESTMDIRSTRLTYMPEGAYNAYLSTKWYVNNGNENEQKRTLNIYPLIRTSELRFIIAECDARKGDFASAYSILNTMRSHRGLSKELDVQDTFAKFQNDLVREGQREWISEGQLFYLYKRLKANVKRDDGTSSPFTTKESVLPQPINESK